MRRWFLARNRLTLFEGLRWGLGRLAFGGSPRSSSHIACRLVNSLGTRSRFRLVRGLFCRSSGRLVVGLRTGSRSGIGSRDMLVHGRFDRRPGSLGSAWSQVEVFEVET